jgi:23S rRNA pseudouridine2605 synthase
VTPDRAKSSLRREGKGQRVGLARALSKLGYCSRSKAFSLIREGRVKLNGTTPRDPETPARLGLDRVEVDGKEASAAGRAYLMLNKPRGVVTTAHDEKGRETIYSLLPKDREWMAPVGRLDKASEGLLLLTNDSAWGARITDPDSHLAKTYHVQIAAVAAPRLLESLEWGVEMPNGQKLKARRASLVRSGERNSWIEIVLDEGKNRQIRRMLEALGVEVRRLVRVAIGPLQLGELAKGAHRSLRPEEKEALDRAIRSFR